MRLLGPADIRRALPMAQAIDAMRDAFAAHARGRAQSPPRAVVQTGKDSGATLVMTAALDGEGDGILTVKAVSVFPANPRRGLPSIHGTLLVIDAATGVPQALLDGAALTAIRTAAACGLATDQLARPDSTVLAVFGSGVHARTQVRAVQCVRPIREVRIFNPNRKSADAMAQELTAVRPIAGGYRAVATAAEALAGAHVACLATTSVVPVLEDRHVPDGIHINAIGSFKPTEREIPTGTVARSLLVVDDRESALEEAGDLLIPIAEGVLGEDHIHADLGSLVLGWVQGRSSATQVTLFKSVGLAVQDAAAARVVVREAQPMAFA
ncbi:MAG: ornithine cyclodeaminase family protein [Bryobacterales bacterium]|nr:ornithine cyclodeaminase family protein [Bryobacterales bacterium]